MEALGFVALAALVIKVVSVIKAIGKDNNMVVTQLVVWVVGIVVLFLGGEADITSQMVIPGFSAVPISDLDAASVILSGLILGSSGAFAYDIKKAIDSSDRSTEPSLISDPNRVA
jgi:hypothetical protein